MVEFSSIVLVDKRGWILLQERDERPELDPDKWGFVGGHVEEGEEFEAAAYRELAEETGVHLDGGLELYKVFDIVHAHSHSEDRFGFFARRSDLTDADLECHEGRQIVFVDPATVGELDLTQAAALALPDFLTSETYAALRIAP